MKYISVLLFLLISFSASSQVVYKTPSGEKYHTRDCRYVSNKAEGITLAEAKKKGLEACKVCKPASSPRSFSSSGSQSSQCKGKTKAGAQCKLMTKSASGYCHHHD